MSEVNQEQVAELAKILQDTSPEEWEALKVAVDELKGIGTSPASGLPCKYVVNSEAASLITDEGMTITFTKQGDVSAAWRGKKLTPVEGEHPRAWVPIFELMNCLRHITRLAIDDLKNIPRIAGHEPPEDKVRYMTTKAGRKAFAYGLIMGRKN